MTYRTGVITTHAELESLRDDWNVLADKAGSPLLSHEWFMAATEAFCPEENLHVLAVWNRNQLVAAAPLTRVNRRYRRRLELIGASRLYEPSGLLFDGPDALLELCRLLVAQGRPVALQRILHADAIEPAIHGVCPRSARLTRQESARSPYVMIDGSWDSYFASLSSRRRYDFRRTRTRLEQQGAVSFQCHVPTGSTLNALLRQGFEVESSGWKGRQGSGLAVNPALREFFTKYAERAATQGRLRICFLNVKENPVAMQLAIVANRRWWVLKTGYDEAWAEYSPGIQLTMETVRHAFESGYDALEFLGTSEPWLNIWTHKEHAYSNFVFYPSTAYGQAYWAIDRTLQRLGNIKNRF